MGVIDRPINGVDNPSGSRFLDGGVAAFFAEHGDVWKFKSKLAGDEALAADIEVQLDVVLRCLVDLLGPSKMSPHELASGARGRFSGGQGSGGEDRFHSNLANSLSGPLPIPKSEGSRTSLAWQPGAVSRGPTP